MPVSGNQRYMRAGSRLLFQRDPIGGTVQGMFDLGTIKTANPTQNLNKIELFDGDGGTNQVVASAVTQFDETYDIETNNFAPQNLALVFSSAPPSDYTKTATQVTSPTIQIGGPGTLAKMTDGSGESEYNLSHILGFYIGGDLQSTVTAMTKSSNTITCSADLSTMPVGSHFIIGTNGLADTDNAGTYEVASVSGSGPTDIVINPLVRAIATDETAITGELVGSVIPGSVLHYKKDWDFDAAGLRRGYAKILDGYATAPNSGAAGTLTGVYRTNAISGDRLILPQTVQGEVKGKLWLFWSEDNFGTEIVREASASITPSTTNIDVANFSSATLQVKLISDLQASQPAGRLIQVLGDLPATV